MKKMLLIYNPLSGKGLVRSSLSSILESFAQAGYEMTVHPTQGVLDGAKTARERAADFDLVACCGGDGTLDEVVTGLMQSGVKRPIAYIPAGSTNDFANSLGLPRTIEQAAQSISKGSEFICDLGKFNDDYFVYIAAFGIFTDVSYQTPQGMKNTFGHTAYLLEGMKRMGTWKSNHLKIACDEITEEGDYVFGMITNSNFVGGFKGIAGTNVELNDGLFEVLLVHYPTNLSDWQEIITAVLTHDTTSKKALMFTTRKITIESDEPLPWTRDGENGGSHTRVEVENLQGEITLLV